MTDADTTKTGWLERIQALDDHRKRQIVVATSLVSTLLILTVWAKYFDLVVTSTVARSQTPAVAAESFSFGQTMQTGLATIYSQLRDVLGQGLERLRAPREYQVLPNNNQ